MGKAVKLGERGQSLVEFAVLFPIFMLILGGMIQLGIILWASNTLNQVVRDTGRYAATVCQSSNAVSDSQARFDALYANSAGPWTSPTRTVAYAPDVAGSPSCPDDNRQTSWVTVNASIRAFIFFPLVPADGRVSSSTTFRVEPRP
jgi:Flp pilus assembly protein TadG